MTQKDDIAKLNSTVYGNGDEGLTTRVALLERSQSEMVWWLRGIGAAVIFYFLNSVLGMFQLPPASAVVEPPAIVSVATPGLLASTRPTEPATVADTVTDGLSDVVLPVLRTVGELLGLE